MRVGFLCPQCGQAGGATLVNGSIPENMGCGLCGCKDVTVFIDEVHDFPKTPRECGGPMDGGQQ